MANFGAKTGSYSFNEPRGSFTGGFIKNNQLIKRYRILKIMKILPSSTFTKDLLLKQSQGDVIK